MFKHFVILVLALGCARPQVCGRPKCKTFAANTSKIRWESTYRSSAELEDHLRPARRSTNGLPGARRVVAGGFERDQGDCWDSGKVSSDQSLLVDYAGRPLTSRQQCFWKVRAWDRDDKPSAWSTPAEVGHGPAGGRRLEGPMDRRSTGRPAVPFPQQVRDTTLPRPRRPIRPRGFGGPGWRGAGDAVTDMGGRPGFGFRIFFIGFTGDGRALCLALYCECRAVRLTRHGRRRVGFMTVTVVTASSSSSRQTLQDRGIARPLLFSLAHQEFFED